MRELGLLVGVVCLVGCPTPHPTKNVQNPTTQATPTATQKPEEEEIGLLSVRLAAISAQVACVYGGWTCQSGEQLPLLRCTTDGGKTFPEVSAIQDRCVYLDDNQISRDGSALWFSCAGAQGVPYIVRSIDGGKSFTASEPLWPKGELVAWSFMSTKSGSAVIALDDVEEALDAQEKNPKEKIPVYLERTTSDGGATWKTLLEINSDMAASFNPEQEIGKRPASPQSDAFKLQHQVGPDGGPAYRLEDNSAKVLLSLSWGDIPRKCSKASPLPTKDPMPELTPGKMVP